MTAILLSFLQATCTSSCLMQRGRGGMRSSSCLLEAKAVYIYNVGTADISSFYDRIAGNNRYSQAPFFLKQESLSSFQKERMCVSSSLVCERRYHASCNAPAFFRVGVLPVLCFNVSLAFLPRPIAPNIDYMVEGTPISAEEWPDDSWQPGSHRPVFAPRSDTLSSARQHRT